MVRRSLSFPGSCSRTARSFHVRSSSLPCRSHPIVSQIEDGIRGLRDWKCHPESETCSTSTWLCAGLTQLELLFQYVNDMLQLQYVHDSIRPGSIWTENVLEAFLCFIDAYGTFRSTVYDIKDQLSATQLAMRRQDDAKLSSCLRSQKRTEKDLATLALQVQEILKFPASQQWSTNAEEAEVARIMRELTSITASTSQSIFMGIAAASSATSTGSSKSSWFFSAIKKRMMTSKGNFKVDELEKTSECSIDLMRCIDVLESRIDSVFRSLMTIRVSLLNILSS